MGLALLLSGVANVCAQDSISAHPLNLRERAALFPTPASIEQGRALAAAQCSDCHGIDGVSTNPDRPHLAGQRSVYLYRQMLAYREGIRSDPQMREALAFLDADALLKTAVYYASLSPPFNRELAESAEEIRGRLDDDPLTPVKAATAGCGSCHGAGGNSTVPGMPSLTAQHPDYFVDSMQAYQSGERTDSMMQMLVAALDEGTIRGMGTYYALQEPRAKTSAVAGDPDAGRLLAEACANCHGADGNASGADMPTLAGQDPVYLVKAMQDYLNGQRAHGPMQSAMQGLSDQQIKDMAAFYVSQTPIARRVRPPLTAAQWLERCDRCHGVGGNSTDPRYARLSGQNEQYLVSVLEDYADGKRSDSIMHAMSEPLSARIIDRLAAFYAAQEPRSVVYFELPCKDQERQ
jgi:cytochrome c553